MITAVEINTYSASILCQSSQGRVALCVNIKCINLWNKNDCVHTPPVAYYTHTEHPWVTWSSQSEWSKVTTNTVAHKTVTICVLQAWLKLYQSHRDYRWRGLCTWVCLCRVCVHVWVWESRRGGVVDYRGHTPSVPLRRRPKCWGWPPARPKPPLSLSLPLSPPLCDAFVHPLVWQLFTLLFRTGLRSPLHTSLTRKTQPTRACHPPSDLCGPLRLVYTQNTEEYRTSRRTNRTAASQMSLLHEENYIYVNITLLLQEYTPVWPTTWNVNVNINVMFVHSFNYVIPSPLCHSF